MYSRFLINQDRKFRSTLIVYALGLAFGICWPLISREFDRQFWPFANGIIIGILLASFVVINELYFTNFRGISRLKFLPVVLITTGKYVIAFGVIVAVELGVSRALENGIPVLDYLKSEDYYVGYLLSAEFRGVLFYTLIATFLVVFGRQLSKKLGSNMIFLLVSGKYHHPHKEKRIFLNVDISGSTSIAERLSNFEYHSFIHDFIYDITGPIISTKGEFYRYIGDGAIVTWPYDRGIDKSNCIRSIFLINHEIESRAEYYLNTYGFKPSFTIGMHIGEVVIGEIGYIKSQVTLNGSVVYDTDKLEKNCKNFGVQNLVSADLLKQVKLPSVFDSVRVGKLQNGKGEELECFTLNEKDVFYSA